jgi:hypothetical protein
VYNLKNLYLIVLAFVLQLMCHLVAVQCFFIKAAFAQNAGQKISESKFGQADSGFFLINGFANFSAASRNQVTAFEQKKLPDQSATNFLNNEAVIENDSQFFFKAGLTTQNKAKYGAVAKVEFNLNSDYRNETPNLDQAFIFSKNSFGKFEFGNNQAVNQTMKAGPASFARGAGGVNGKYLENINLPALSSANCGNDACSNVKLPQFILLPQSPIGHGGYARSFYSGVYSDENEALQNDSGNFNRMNFRAFKDNSFDGMEDATKISYYLPPVKGLQLGISYAPNSADNGITSTKYFNVDTIQINNIVSFGASYAHDFDNLAVKLSATAEKGQVQNSQSATQIARYDLSSYDLAATFSYFGFSLGASYGSWGKSLQPKSGIYSCDYNSGLSLDSQDCSVNATKFQNPYYYTLGISYVFGPIAASITAIKSQFQKNNYQAVSAGIDYKFSRDLMPYFEFTKFTFKSNQPKTSDIDDESNIAIYDNCGYVFLTGILISF